MPAGGVTVVAGGVITQWLIWRCEWSVIDLQVWLISDWSGGVINQWLIWRCDWSVIDLEVWLSGWSVIDLEVWLIWRCDWSVINLEVWLIWRCDWSVIDLEVWLISDWSGGVIDQWLIWRCDWSDGLIDACKHSEITQNTPHKLTMSYLTNIPSDLIYGWLLVIKNECYAVSV